MQEPAKENYASYVGKLNTKDLPYYHYNDLEREWLAYTQQEKPALELLLKEFLGNDFWVFYDPELHHEKDDGLYEALLSDQFNFVEQAKVSIKGTYHGVWVCTTKYWDTKLYKNLHQRVVRLAYNGCSAHGALDCYFIRDLPEKVLLNE